jgi:DNA-binding SARP family transcriptional activator/tetratricopeptide (TPR) repeat protein
MWFGIIGPLQVRARDHEEPVNLSATRLRVLLAVLLWRANEPMAADEIAGLIWDGAPPAGALEAVRALVMRLRRRLDPEVAARIVTRSPGYAIEISADELDASCLETLTRQAGAEIHAGQWERAAVTTTMALQLWRGTPLADVPSQLLRDQWVPRLDQQHLQALEWRLESNLHDGHHEQVIPELRDLTARHPMREHFHSQLMLALYRSGRQAEALAAYQHARDVLVTELGIEPGPDLRELHQRILSADPALSITGPDRTAVSGPAPDPPRELPSTVPGFTGRSAELKALNRLLDRRDVHVPGTVVISAIGGTAGVGKTALALHWAHQMAGNFPDGQLYVNLRGYDSGQPMSPNDALADFLRSLGVPSQDVPPEQDARAARYRTLMAGRRMLVMLDNAGSAAQARPLLPAAPACTVIVTSRDALAGLVARDGASRLNLDILPLHDAVQLLRTLIGARVDAEPDAATELARQCCQLPLALRVAAELAASRPATPLSRLAAELADLSTRLDLLDAGGDPSTQVRGVFSWSYNHLDAVTARTFRLLGLHPGPDVEPYAAAALAGTTVPQARQALDVLAHAHLIQPAEPGRHGMHDLLRAYARELTMTHDAETAQHAALTGLFDYYLHTAAAAMDLLFPADRHSRPRTLPATAAVPPLTDSGVARDWLDAECAVLLAIAAHTATHDWPSHAIRLATTLSRYLRNCGHVPEALTIFGHGLVAARRVGDPAAEAALLNQLGNVHAQQNRIQLAADHHRQALTLFRAAGERAGEAQVLGNLGLDETQLGRHEEAARHQHEAVAVYREIGDRDGEARSLINLGISDLRQGRYQEAGGYYKQALDLFRELEDREGEAFAVGGLGICDLRLGRYERAADYLQRSLALCHEMGHTVGEVELLARLGEVYLGLGRDEQATENLEQALALSRDVGDQIKEADALNGMGEVLFHTGRAAEARTHHASALQLVSEVDAPLEQARAHSGLARICDADGDSLQSRHHWQEALARYDAAGAPEARDIRARLANPEV